MPIVSRCPMCQRQVRVPENLLGRKVRCPACHQTFTAGAGGASAPAEPRREEEAPRARRPPEPPQEEGFEEVPAAPPRRPPRLEEPEYEEEPAEEEYEEEEEYERPRRRRGGRADWAKVRTGVTLLMIGVILQLAMMFIGGTIGGIQGARTGAAAGGGLQPGQPGAEMQGFAAGGGVAQVISTLINLVIAGLMLAGDVLCVAAPRKHGAKTLATTAAILMGVGLLGQLLAVVSLLARPLALLLLPILVLALLCVLAHLFVELSFLRAVARCLRAGGLETSVKNLIILFAAAIALLIISAVLLAVFFGAMFAVAFKGGANPGGAAAGFGVGMLFGVGCCCVDLLLFLTASVWHIIVLVQTRNQLAYFLERG